jgi:glycosyltransferase involved in cell wall biosynthesis
MSVRPLRIGINALYLIPGHVGGTEIYLRSLLAALAEIDSVNRYFVFTNRETGADLVPDCPNFKIAPQPVRAMYRFARILWEQTVLPCAAAYHRLDVMLNPGFTVPLVSTCPRVTVFHDLQHKRHPEYFRWFDLPFWNFFLFWAAHLSKLLLVPSRATAVDVLRQYRLPTAKVRTVRSGVDRVFFQLGRERRPEPFLLAVSTLHPHKNLDGLLEAFAWFRGRRPEFRLVICGLRGHHTKRLLELRASLGLGDSVELPGWIPRKDLYSLFQRAWAFFYPSRFEGFGLPLLEALAAGVPSVYSDIPPLTTFAGKAALPFHAEDPGALRDAMVRIVEDEPLRERLALAGPCRAAEFSWRETAEAALAALREAAG